MFEYKGKFMKRLVSYAIAAASLFGMTATQAAANPRHDRHYQQRKHNGNGAVVAGIAGVVIGAVIASNARGRGYGGSYSNGHYGQSQGYYGSSPYAPAYGYGGTPYGYGAPAYGYGSPAYGYGAPAYGYGAPAYGYAQPRVYVSRNYSYRGGYGVSRKHERKHRRAERRSHGRHGY